jgi:hypothetical protein
VVFNWKPGREGGDGEKAAGSWHEEDLGEKMAEEKD